MRWHTKPTRQAELGDRKVRRKFLWFPLCIDGETRWLERAIVEWHYGPLSGWTPWRFIDLQPVNESEIIRP